MVSGNKNKKAKLLMLATSRQTKGGITSVLKAYEQCAFWKTYQVRWIETHIDHGLLPKALYFLKALLQFVFHIRHYDLIHIHIGEQPSITRKYIFLKIAKWCKKKTIVHVHTGTQILSDRELREGLQLMLKKTDAVIVLSSNIQKKVKDLFSLKEVYVVSNPCPTLNNVVYTDQNNYILYMGALNRNKGYDILIKAFALIAANHPQWKLIFAGEGETKQALQLAKECGIEEKVIALGWVAGEEKDRIFRNASIFCLSSYAEGFPMSVLESWAYGLPLITTAVGGLSDILRDGENALVFSPGNKNELADKLTQLINDSKLRKKLSNASLELASDCNLKAINETITSLYDHVLR